MSEKLGDTLNAKENGRRPSDSTYKAVINDVRTRLPVEIAKRVSAPGASLLRTRVVLQKPDGVSSDDFTYIMNDHNNRHVANLLGWLASEKLTVSFLGDEILVHPLVTKIDLNVAYSTVSTNLTDVLLNKKENSTYGSRNTLGFSWSDFQNKLTNLSNFLESLSSVLINLSKIIGILSPILGFILLLGYLRRATAPFPPIDSSSSVLLFVIAAVFVYVFIVLGGIIICVEACKVFVKRKELVSFVPDLRPNFVNLSRSFFKVVCQYVLLYNLFLSIIFLGVLIQFRSNLLSILSNLNVDFSWLAASYHKVNLFVAEHFSFMPAEYHRGLLVIVYGSLISLFISLVGFRFINGKAMFYSFWASVFSFFWFAISYKITIMFETAVTYPLIAFLLTVVFLLFLHFVANITVYSSPVNVISFGFLLFFLSFLILGPAPLGAITLHMLGIGGGIPATFQIKVPADADGKTTVRSFPGCLILVTSGQVILHEILKNETRLDCRITSTLWNKEVADPTFSQADTYLRSDVIRIYNYK